MSGNYPSNYQNGEYCYIEVQGELDIVVEAFDTEAFFDRLTINGMIYNGMTGPSMAIFDGGITWISDAHSPTRSGWRLCPHVTVGTVTDSAGTSVRTTFFAENDSTGVTVTETGVVTDTTSVMGV